MGSWQGQISTTTAPRVYPLPAIQSYEAIMFTNILRDLYSQSPTVYCSSVEKTLYSMILHVLDPDINACHLRVEYDV